MPAVSRCERDDEMKRKRDDASERDGTERIGRGGMEEEEWGGGSDRWKEERGGDDARGRKLDQRTYTHTLERDRASEQAREMDGWID